jgi:GNAT superfamily N-acetyltransferase
MDEMKIRKAVTADAENLISFNQAMARETEGKTLDLLTLKNGVEAVFRDDSKGFYVVADEGGRIVGGLMVTFEWSDWRDKWFWWIQSVYVVPDARGKRVYSELYEFVRSAAAGRGDVAGFRLYVEHDNEHAQAVYKKLGMNESHYLMFEEEK